MRFIIGFGLLFRFLRSYDRAAVYLNFFLCLNRTYNPGPRALQMAVVIRNVSIQTLIDSYRKSIRELYIKKIIIFHMKWKTE